jgi:hypothetical protein
MDAHDEYSATGATFQTFNSSRIDDGIAFVARDHQPGTGNRLDGEFPEFYSRFVTRLTHMIKNKQLKQ